MLKNSCQFFFFFFWKSTLVLGTCCCPALISGSWTAYTEYISLVPVMGWHCCKHAQVHKCLTYEHSLACDLAICSSVNTFLFWRSECVMELSIILLLWCHRYELHTRNDWKLCCFLQVETVFKSLQSEAQKSDLTESYNKPSCILFLPPFELCSFFPPSSTVLFYLCIIVCYTADLTLLLLPCKWIIKLHLKLRTLSVW